MPVAPGPGNAAVVAITRLSTGVRGDRHRLVPEGPVPHIMVVRVRPTAEAVEKAEAAVHRAGKKSAYDDRRLVPKVLQFC